MINIIANNCVGARCYEILQQQFDNPFMWSIVLPNDFLYLIQNFSRIDFNNVKIFKEWFEPLKLDTYGINIDNQIKAFFIHHRYDEKAITPEKRDVNLFYKDIDKYLIDEWKKRALRMGICPHFICVANGLWNDEMIQKFITLKTNYKKSLIAYDKKYLKHQTTTFDVTIVRKNISTYQIAKKFLSTLHQI